MSYSPGNQGYYGAYTPRPPKAEGDTALLAQYLGMAVVALGFTTYLVSYGPTFDDPGIGWGTRFAVLAGLAAGCGLLCRQAPNGKLIATLAAAGFLEALSDVITTSGDHRGWAAVAIVVLNGLQALVAVGVLLAGADTSGAQASQSAYQAYVDYYEKAARYYGQYGQQQPQPETTMTQAGSAHAQQTHRVGAREQNAGSGAASYADYVGHYEQAAAPAPSAAQNQRDAAPDPQAGLPRFGEAQGPAQQAGGNDVAQQWPSAH